MALLKHAQVQPASGALCLTHTGMKGGPLIMQSRTSVAVPPMRVAAQISPFWRGTGGHAGDQVGAHSGYSASSSWVFVTESDVVLNRQAIASGMGL